MSMTLRKLEAVGCIKQVKARDGTLRNDSKLFRCVKLIREPGEKESQRIFGPAHRNMRPMNTEEVADLGLGDELDEDDQAEQQLGSEMTMDDSQPRNLKEIERPITQWTGVGCINNMIYDLVDKSGTEGLSTMVQNRLHS